MRFKVLISTVILMMIVMFGQIYAADFFDYDVYHYDLNCDDISRTGTYTSIYLGQDYYSGFGQYARSAGNSITFSYYGKNAIVHALKYTRSGAVDVYLDNVFYGNYVFGTSSDYVFYDIQVVADDIDDHTITVVLTDYAVRYLDSSSSVAQQGYMYINYFSYDCDTDLRLNHFQLILVVILIVFGILVLAFMLLRR